MTMRLNLYHIAAAVMQRRFRMQKRPDALEKRLELQEFRSNPGEYGVAFHCLFRIDPEAPQFAGQIASDSRSCV